MEKKNKKKLFAIIGGSALAFILTIALSVSITLAYFGGTANSTATVKMSGDVTVEDFGTLTGTIYDALPGEKITIAGNFNVKSSGTATGEDIGAGTVAATPAFVRLTLTDDATVGNSAAGNFFSGVLTVDNTVVAVTGGKWLPITGTGEAGETLTYLYLVADDETATDETAKLLQIPAGQNVKFSFNATVNKNLDNTWAGEVVGIEVLATAIQGELPINDGPLTADVTIAQAKDVFAQVESGTNQVPNPDAPAQEDPETT